MIWVGFLFAFIRVHSRLQVGPRNFRRSTTAAAQQAKTGTAFLHPANAPHSNRISGQKGNRLFTSGKCAAQQPHFRAKREPIFFFRNKFLRVLKLLADWNLACGENRPLGL
jgi:hypothetical protein